MQSMVAWYIKWKENQRDTQTDREKDTETEGIYTVNNLFYLTGNKEEFFPRSLCGKVKLLPGHLTATVRILHRLQYPDLALDFAQNSRGQQTVVNNYDEKCN